MTADHSTLGTAPGAAPPLLAPAERHALVSRPFEPARKTTPKHIDQLLHRCCERGGCLLDNDFGTDHPPPIFPRRSRSPAPLRDGHRGEDAGTHDLAPLIFNSASAAQWRRRGASLGNSRVAREGHRPLGAEKPISSQELVLKVAVMEEVHGVDVSWLHKPTKEKSNDKDNKPPHRRHISAAPVFNTNKEPKQPKVSANDVSQQQRRQQQPTDKASTELSKLPSPPNITPPTPVQPTKDTTQAVPSTPTPSSSNGKTPPKRPNILGRQSSEKLTEEAKAGSRRQSWMTSLSSKFSSQPTPPRPSPTPTQPAGKQVNGNAGPATNGAVPEEAMEEAEQYTPPKQKESSFFSSLTRRLSAASQSSGIPKAQGTVGVCPRKVLNVDPNRERCLVPEMDPNRLRKVSFCVDVEIAGGPRYYDDDEDDETRTQKKKEFKMKERAEGEALKRPAALKDEKEAEGEPKLESKSKAIPVPPPKKAAEEKGPEENSAPKNSLDDEAAARKKEKKKKSEEERKERKEKRRRRAEENGSIPVELSLDTNDADTKAGSSASGTPSPPNGTITTQQPQPPSAPTPTRQDRPTTDPARIYRRCCQLRETPILKRITEQLMHPKSSLPTEPGIVSCLDLTGSRLQLADVVTLGDWLAVVPVKHLKLEDADLNDEGVRCILAGLLAAKRPEPTKRRSGPPKHREGLPNTPHKERAGVIERITFKNNPRITRLGWKHISLFLYMCRSLKAIDVSMNQFPDTLPPSAHSTPVKSPQNAPPGRSEDVDAAEMLYKCLSERLAGSRLEEFIVSECGLSAAQIRKIVDGCIVSGVSRLGLAGNHLDDDGLEHIIHYLRSNVCQALDLGGNDLRGKLGIVAEALRSKAAQLPCWGLSLADCNLDSASLKPLFATLQQLPNFRFIDLSHNRDLCSADNGLVSLLRRYISHLPHLKRVHLSDVGMSSKQAIALADVLPEGPRLAHLNLLENPKLVALAHAKSEEDQEEACALYASLMAAVRVSSTLICIDIDVPDAESSELVKALAKQVVAYSLRNMEEFAIAEATGNAVTTANATAALTGPHGGEKVVKDISVPDVLWHLVGHVEGNPEDHDADAPAPDEDYIVGGTGVVKALQYVLGEKANDARRTSLPQTPRSGTVTPTLQRPDSSAGLVEQQKGKAKKMSKNLLDSARKIRNRLQPALMKEASQGDEMAYRRLLFLDQTLQSMIERFEEEYPECRLKNPAHAATAGGDASLSADDKAKLLSSSAAAGSAQGGTELASNVSDDEDMFIDAEDGEPHVRPTTMSRHNSDVSLASRKQVQEEGHLHRLGIQLRREIIAADEGGERPSSRSREGSGMGSPATAGSRAPSSDQQGALGSSTTAATAAAGGPEFPTRTSSLSPAPAPSQPPTNPEDDDDDETEEQRIRRLGAEIESLSGVDLRQVLHDNQGWENALRKIGANYEDLRRLQELDPEGWEGFKVSQRGRVWNERQQREGGSGQLRGEGVPPEVPPKD